MSLLSNLKHYNSKYAQNVDTFYILNVSVQNMHEFRFTGVQIFTDQINDAEQTFATIVTELQQHKDQLSSAENQYNKILSINDNLKKQSKIINAKYNEVLEQLEAERRAKTDIYMQYQEEKLQIVTREKDLAIHEADFYRLQAERNLSSNATTKSAHGKVPKISEFQGATVGFPRWISWVSDLFDNYPQFTDFNKRIMVVDSLKGEARSWYDAEPDTSTTSWIDLKDALLKQYGGTNSISNALNTISSMKLTIRSDFNTFIQRIRPAIQLVAKEDGTLAIAIIRQQIDTDIRRYLPEVQNESFASFEQRLCLQFPELQTKPLTVSNNQHTSPHTPMDLDTIVAPIRQFNNTNQPASPFGSRSQTQFRPRNMQPHNSRNT
ncbi:hypothetical protein BB559_005403, partial [Furculomyces boomerangus]